jgi:hypothetical protein
VRLTETDLEAIQSLHQRTPYQIFGVSTSQLSIARLYGVIRFNGCQYTYDDTDDTLTRDDVLKAVRKLRKTTKGSGR